MPHCPTMSDTLLPTSSDLQQPVITPCSWLVPSNKTDQLKWERVLCLCVCQWSKLDLKICHTLHRHFLNAGYFCFWSLCVHINILAIRTWPHPYPPFRNMPSTAFGEHQFLSKAAVGGTSIDFEFEWIIKVSCLVIAHNILFFLIKKPLISGSFLSIYLPSLPHTPSYLHKVCSLLVLCPFIFELQKAWAFMVFTHREGSLFFLEKWFTFILDTNWIYLVVPVETEK